MIRLVTLLMASVCAVRVTWVTAASTNAKMAILVRIAHTSAIAQNTLSLATMSLELAFVNQVGEVYIAKHNVRKASMANIVRRSVPV